jgi:stearoyl-CoA desaturase (delta-9 desaturase)
MHRHHHQYSDAANDTHSPRHHGFAYAHLGWIFSKKNAEPDYESVADLMEYPELVWMNKHQYVVPAILGFVVWLLAGWSGLVVGFLWSTMVLWHFTFFINSLAHVHGSQRYLTGDDSRNNWWLAVLTCGEGWHNNHHAYQSSTRQGFRWYQVDFTYYVLRAVSWTGLIWDLRAPPADVVNNERKLGRLVVEKVARQVADTFSPDGVAAQVRSAWENSHMWPDVQAWAHAAGAQAAAKLATVHLPELPTVQEIRDRAAETFRVPEVSLDEVTERARILLIQAVSVRIMGETQALPA